MRQKITRPILRYHGGKFLLAEWILSNFPSHRIYTEPFGGAASVLLQKDRSYSEVYNDLDCELVNLFRVVRDHGRELQTMLSLTPFSRKEFETSYIPSDDVLEQARRTVVRSFLGFGSAAASGQKTGYRSNSNKSGTTPAIDWQNFPNALPAIIERLQGVNIENTAATRVMLQNDSSDTLHFLDPPYVLSTRYKKDKTKSYRFEMSNEDHEEMCSVVNNLKGMVIICGYDNPIYDLHLSDWNKVIKKSYADGAKERTEVLYINPLAYQKLKDERAQLSLEF